VLPTSGSIPESGRGADPRLRQSDRLGQAVLADAKGLQKLLIEQLPLVCDCWTRVATDAGGHVDVD
jgi:hypothetical protein